MKVGIRELKAKLSELVDKAARGEPIYVTDRGIVKAMLVPVPDQFRLNEGIEGGWVRRGDKADEAPSLVRRESATASIRAVLDEDRGA
jgi:prevent-host-death family protein